MYNKQLAERMWRKAVMSWVDAPSAFDVSTIVDKLDGIEFNQDGTIVERGRSYGFLSKRVPTILSAWKKLMEDRNGKNETKGHREGKQENGGKIRRGKGKKPDHSTQGSVATNRISTVSST